ncbi:MAG: DNA translocase FtsK 4TM domain-containing protein [Anaerolineae bacterium]|nr:DNA translocase FtsK 4TM domain-containing protein [Anaerolineae bacterium]
MAQKPSTPRSKKAKPAQPPPTWDEKFINSLIPWRVEIAGILFFLFAMITLLALPGVTQADWLDAWTNLLRQIFGWGTYPLFFIFALVGLLIALRKVKRPLSTHIRTSQIVGLELIWLALLPISHLLTGATQADAYLGLGGGLVGWALSEPLLDLIGPFLTWSLYLALLLWGFALVFKFGWVNLLETLNHISIRLRQVGERLAPPARPKPVTTPVPTIQTSPAVAVPLPQNKQTQADELIIIDDSADYGDGIDFNRRDKRLPPIDILDKGSAAVMSPAEIDEKKRIIEETLADFHIPAKVIEIQRGPAITQFGVEPGYVIKTGSDGEIKEQKIRINQIASLRPDLAMALAVTRLRIEAPVPGRGVVGIEVPNNDISIVRMRTIMESDAFAKIKSPLGVALGQGVSGSPMAIDLTKLPHLLIAGTTGSGKSVLMNALISCLVFNNGPERLKLIMIDPKKVELIRFNGLPHLIGSVEVEADRAVGVLRWLTAEMDRRYEMFSLVGARNLAGYNQKIARDKDKKKLPYLAVFIDELADLMHMYPGDVERTLCRLAQMARATGIHLVVATQRPSTDVITGLIKANFPARLSFSVASGIDSRVILDSTGAEQLLGKGDMLFQSPDAAAPVRAQGVFLSDNEIERIVTHWQKIMPDFEPMPTPWDTLIAKHALLDETDQLLEQAIEIAQKQEFLSTSLLQRRLRIGFPRAARIMEHLYEMGLVEDPKTGGKTRKSYVEESEEDPFENLLNQEEDE